MSALKKLMALGAGAITMSLGSAAYAIPNLQLYIEGADYCANCPGGYADSWAISGEVGLRIWVMADAPVYDVQFVVSYNDVPGNAPTPVFTPVLVGDAPTAAGIITNPAAAYPGITDTLLPGAVGAGVFEGPLGSLENNEGKYNSASRDWYVFDLGDMATNETKGADLVPPGFTGAGGTASGQVGFMLNVYDITFLQAALVGEIVNFGVWACEDDGCPEVPQGQSGNTKVNYVNMPNSHDAQWLQTGSDIPVPATLGLFGLGLVGLGALRRRRAA